MAMPWPTFRYVDPWIGSLPSPWWIYLQLRLRGDLSPEASGAAVRRVVREAIDKVEGPVREHRAILRAKGLSRREARRVPLPPDVGGWSVWVAFRLFEEKLLSPKGEAALGPRLDPELAARLASGSWM